MIITSFKMNELLSKRTAVQTVLHKCSRVRSSNSIRRYATFSKSNFSRITSSIQSSKWLMLSKKNVCFFAKPNIFSKSHRVLLNRSTDSKYRTAHLLYNSFSDKNKSHFNFKYPSNSGFIFKNAKLRNNFSSKEHFEGCLDNVTENENYNDYQNNFKDIPLSLNAIFISLFAAFSLLSCFFIFSDEYNRSASAEETSNSSDYSNDSSTNSEDADKNDSENNSNPPNNDEAKESSNLKKNKIHLLLRRIRRVLRSWEKSRRDVDRGLVSEVHVNQFAANDEIEDTFSVVPVLQSAGGSLFGVYDGHSGNGASLFCRDELIAFIQKYFNDRVEIDGEDREKYPLLTPYPFILADTFFLVHNLAKERHNVGVSGASYAMTHIRKKEVTIAHAGDCRAVIGRETNTKKLREKGTLDDGNKEKKSIWSKVKGVFKGNNKSKDWEAVFATQDHRIDTHLQEKQRLLQLHADEPDIIRRNRVKGRLEPTRGLGDGIYKMKEYYLKQPRRFQKRYPVWNPPYTTAEPDISKFTLTPQDKFLILATDGLFDFISSEEAVEIVGRVLNSNNDDKVNLNMNLSSHLIEAALVKAAKEYKPKGESDSEKPHPYEVIVNPPIKRRKIHDDVTVIVVVFDHHRKLSSSRKKKRGGKYSEEPNLSEMVLGGEVFETFGPDLQEFKPEAMNEMLLKNYKLKSTLEGKERV